MSTIKVDSIKSADGNTDLLTLSNGAVSGVNLGRRNLIINGAMRIAQRGTGGSSVGSGYFSVDRWYRNTASNTTTGQGSDSTVGYYVYTTLDTNGYTILRQNVEEIPFIGSAKDYTLSFKAKVSTGTEPLRVILGNETDATTIYSNSNVATLTTSWQTFTVTQSFGTDDSLDEVSVNIGVTGGTSGTILYVTDVQLEVGSVATPFEHRSYGEELALCQRYYQKNDVGSFYCPVTRASDSNRRMNVQFPTTMRADPTVVLTSTSLDGGSLTVIDTTPYAVYIFGNTSDAPQPALHVYTAEAEL